MPTEAGRQGTESCLLTKRRKRAAKPFAASASRMQWAARAGAPTHRETTAQGECPTRPRDRPAGTQDEKITGQKQKDAAKKIRQTAAANTPVKYGKKADIGNFVSAKRPNEKPAERETVRRHFRRRQTRLTSLPIRAGAPAPAARRKGACCARWRRESR